MFTRFFTRREWFLLALGAALIICQVYMDIAIPDYMSKITDAFLLEAQDKVMQYGVEMIAAAFLSLIFSLLVGYVLAVLAASTGKNMRLAQFDRVQSYAMEDINRFSAASLITRSTNDITQIQNFIARGLQMAIKSPILAVWALSRMYGSSFVYSGAIAWTEVTIAGLLIVFVVMLTSIGISMPLFKKIQWLTDGVNRSIRENLDGIRVIRAYNAEPYQEGKFDKANEDLLNNNLGTVKYMAYAFPVAQSVMNFVTLAIYWIGAGIIMSLDVVDTQKLAYSDMIVFTSYAMLVLNSCLGFIGIFRMLPRAMVGMKRIEEVVDTEPSIVDGTVTDGEEGIKGAIEFRNVSFTYPGTERKILEDISFKVEPGKTFAIIGSTGSGKTTLVNLMARFYDTTSGDVYVDGVNVRDFSIKALHLKLGYVPQQAIIFSGSVEMNVNFGHGSESRTEEDVKRALRIAQAEDFVTHMPDGMDSHISQHGRNISGGQKQRVSIARAVCREPEIYILDDTFSALDFKTDKALRESLRKETSGSTVVIVAQRIGTIMDADEIIVLDEGRIVGKGKHRELLKTCPIYFDIARSQLTEEELQ
ncbi:MAG: ABC transporter ATP-binding protein/permease [archaeon]|nr:ABC transporter ATP-binding protein/permease [archaeon]